MRVLFLDIDGVLNHDYTTNRISGLGMFSGFTGLDTALLDRYLKWIDGKPYYVVLSSSWRQHDVLHDYLRAFGVEFSDRTPRLTYRGDEVAAWLREHPSTIAYAILDDMDEFDPEQYDNFVQTNPKTGVTDSDLLRVDKLLHE